MNNNKTNNNGRAKGKTQISISVSTELVEEIDKLADSEYRNRSNYIGLVLKAHVDNRKTNVK